MEPWIEQVKFLKTIRFDDTDDNVYEAAAPGDEWAISGAFEFSGLPDTAIVGKTRQGFANGFLGLATFARSTFAVVQDIDEREMQAIREALRQHFVDSYGAPDLEAAAPAAEEEIGFVQDLCKDAPVNTVFTVRRTLDSSGEIREEFRTIRAPDAQPQHARIWDFIDDGDTG